MKSAIRGILVAPLLRQLFLQLVKLCQRHRASVEAGGIAEIQKTPPIPKTFPAESLAQVIAKRKFLDRDRFVEINAAVIQRIGMRQPVLVTIPGATD